MPALAESLTGRIRQRRATTKSSCRFRRQRCQAAPRNPIALSGCRTTGCGHGRYHSRALITGKCQELEQLSRSVHPQCERQGESLHPRPDGRWVLRPFQRIESPVSPCVPVTGSRHLASLAATQTRPASCRASLESCVRMSCDRSTRDRPESLPTVHRDDQPKRLNPGT